MKNYDAIYLLNIPSFYKMNLLNEVAKRANILVILMGGTYAAERRGDFTAKGGFDTLFLSHDDLSHPSKKATLLRTYKLLKTLKTLSFSQLIVGGYDAVEYIAALAYARRLSKRLGQAISRAIICESSIYETSLSPHKLAIKRAIFSLATHAIVAGAPHLEYAKRLDFAGKILVCDGVGMINLPKILQFHSTNSHSTPPEISAQGLARYDEVMHVNALARLKALRGCRREAKKECVEIESSFDKTTPNPTARFLFIGRLVEVKNLRALIEAFSGLPYTLDIIGEGESECARGELEALASVCKASVRFLGYVDNVKLDLKPYGFTPYVSLVLASTSEPYGLVLEEALCGALALLVSDKVGGNTDLVERPRLGVITSCDADSLRAGILQMAKNYESYITNILDFSLSARYEKMIEAYLLNYKTHSTSKARMVESNFDSTALPKISIIIACLDEIDALRESLRAVVKCGYENIEVVVVDSGKIEKGTILEEILGGAVELTLVKIPKNGISDAFNHGVLNASGEYINFQGAGDLLEDLSALKEEIQEAQKEGKSFDLIFGRIKRVEEANPKNIIYFSPYITNFSFSSLLHKMTIPHQALFTHREFFKKYGNFKASKIYSMDYEQLLRAYSDRKDLKILHLDLFISRWRAGGIGADYEKEILAEYYENLKETKGISNLLAKYIHIKQLAKRRLRILLKGK